LLQTLHALDSDQHVAFTSFWRMGTRVARVPPLREPTRSLGSERDEKASAHFGRDDSLGGWERKNAGKMPFEAQGKPALPGEAVATDEGQVEDVGVAGVESDGVVGIRELALDFQRCGEF